ncbi:MAG: nicotinate (nicotinamide) nucleotide adenylyltransferase [Clostridium sp.]|nr:nicotinate (nicotinamide) nucleotide adenylyltransferase [Clostridium sp.]
MERRPVLTGIMGGSFNPVHAGHMMVASWMAQFGGFDEVWLSLSPLNPLKEGEAAASLASDGDRLEMLRIATDEIDRVGLTDIELSMPRPSYTAATLRALSARYPDRRFRLIIGSDNWLLFDRWRNPGLIVSQWGVTVYPRPGYPVDTASLPEGVELVEAPTVSLSSTLVREKIALGADMTCFLPHGVFPYICRNHLYHNKI